MVKSGACGHLNRYSAWNSGAASVRNFVESGECGRGGEKEDFAEILLPNNDRYEYVADHDNFTANDRFGES